MHGLAESKQHNLAEEQQSKDAKENIWGEPKDMDAINQSGVGWQQAFERRWKFLA